MAEKKKYNLNRSNMFQYNATHEQIVANARKAGLASGEANRARRKQREILHNILFLMCDDEEAVAALQALGLTPNFANAANLAMLRKAIKGDVEAMKYIRDTIGEKPADTTQLTLLDKPVAAQDLTQLTDEELEYLADRTEREGETSVALPDAQEAEPVDG